MIVHFCSRVHMPTVTYLRLDGSVPANSRHGLVHRYLTYILYQQIHVCSDLILIPLLIFFS